MTDATASTAQPVSPSADLPVSATAAVPSTSAAVTAEPSQATTPPAETAEAQPSSSVPAGSTDAEPAAASTEAPQAAADVAKPEQTAEAPAEGAEQKPEQPAGTAPTYAEFKMPEGIEAPAPTMAAYTNILGKYNLPQEAGQELLDFHATQMKAAQKAMTDLQQQVFDDTQRKWRASVDKEFGNQRDTIINDAKSLITQYAGNKKQLREVWDVLAFTGAGNHPAVIRMFRNIHRALGEGQAPLPAPLTGTNGLSPADRRYGRKN